MAKKFIYICKFNFNRLVFSNFSCSKRQNACEHKIRVIFSAIDDSVRVETTLAGDHSAVHEPTNVLTDQVKARIAEYHGLSLKPALIRIRLLVNFEILLFMSYAFRKLWMQTVFQVLSRYKITFHA